VGNRDSRGADCKTCRRKVDRHWGIAVYFDDPSGHIIEIRTYENEA
jgi:hypothetical protein